jgi:hypothetical protein
MAGGHAVIVIEFQVERRILCHGRQVEAHQQQGCYKDLYVFHLQNILMF